MNIFDFTEKHTGENIPRWKRRFVIAKTLQRRAFIFNCSYKTAWEQWMEDVDKGGFTFEEVIEGGNNK